MKRGILIITNIIFVIALSYFVNAADFGGIFLSPLSCPAGYKSTQILGDVDGFKDVYLCYKNPGTGGAPFFGGMYIINPDTGATIDGNPMNGGNKGCPNGYDDINVGKITTPVNGAFGVEGKLTGSDTIPHHELHYCKKDNGIAEYSFDGLNGQNKHWNCRTGNEEKSFDGLICPNDPNIARLFLFISASSERPRGCGDGLEFDELDGLILLCSKIITSSPSEAVVYQPQWLDENDNPIRVGVFGKNVKLRTVTQNIIDNTDLRFDVYKQGSPLPLRSFTVKVTGNSAKTASLLLDDVANKNNPNGGREGDSLVIIGTAIDPSDNEELATSVYSQALYIDKSPDVSITFPTNGQAFEEGGMITITASASDPDSSLNGDRVTKVEFFSNGNKLGEDIDSSNGWSFIWDEAPVGHPNYNLC
ncbi:Ig-like domain-containing protein [Candidatus Pacearchaeota archaeon]|nr:Ig-like domain-containing protein [Candidatus Pacearchaeota archaeon]